MRTPGHANAFICLSNRGRSEVEYLCGGLYIINGRSDRQFSIVIRIGGRAVRRIASASIRAPPMWGDRVSSRIEQARPWPNHFAGL